MSDFVEVARQLESLRSMYVTNQRDAAFREQIDRLVPWTTAPAGVSGSGALTFTNTGETRGIMVIDGPGGGKSTLVKRGLQRHPVLSPGGDLPPRYIEASVPSPATIKSMGQHLLAKTHYPMTSTRREAWSMWEILRQRFQLLGTMALWIDEAHDLFCADRNLILRAIKSLMQGEGAVIVILSGTEQLAEILRSDPQVQRRFSTLVLPPVDADADRYDIEAIIEEQCNRVGLRPPAASDLVDRLVHAARHRFGRSIEFSIAAIERALLEDASQLDLDHFAAAWALQEGDGIDRNVFLARDWWEIDPERTREAALSDVLKTKRKRK